jgi:hypothetical protein
LVVYRLADVPLIEWFVERRQLAADCKQ